MTPPPDRARPDLRSDPASARRRSPLPFLVAALAALAPLAASAGASPVSAQTEAAGSRAAVTTDELRAFHPRPIGPAVTGGRITDIEALPVDPSTVYVASASGGLWRSRNRGHDWTALFDDMPVSAFGDVAVAPSDPDVVYAGTGEQNNRQSTTWGDGVYRSDDGGDTWTHLGLEATRHTGEIRVHPDDPGTVYVAALGNLWAPGPERGVYRSRDGGSSWEKVLYVDTLTGAVDLVMDPDDPDVLYAATYQRLRRTWGFNGGGPGSGIWKTTDGGESWTELTEGLPSGDKGRIGLALSRSDPGVVMALVETADTATTGTYRSEDAGASWERVNPLDPRPMYYSHIFIDPTTPERVYVLATDAYRSEDGGRTFDTFAEPPTYDVGVHSDHHALWIDPSDPDHLYMGGDAGLWESYDRGGSFRKVNNIPIGQFYAIGVDMRDPYHVYGGMQDNHSWVGPSRTRRWIGIVGDDWKQVGFSDGMHWDVDPRDHRLAYGSSQGGNYFRSDPETGMILDISPRPPFGSSYRFDWTSPLLVSRHDPRRVYVAGNRLFMSPDMGSSWDMTDDLSRRIDRDTLRLMGVRGSEVEISANDGTSSFGEATTIAESPLDPSVLWVGFDDGNLQVSRDMGSTWTEVSGNVPGLPDGTYVSRVEASRAGPGVAYATFDGHRDGSDRPWVYRTDDWGRSWTPLYDGLPPGPVNVVAEHPLSTDVLFLGTEHHAFVSTDAGRHWARIPNLPTVPYDDLLVHPRDGDLVLGTHGRSVWVLDDTGPLVAWSRAAADARVHLFPVRAGTLFHWWKDTSYRGQAEWHGDNPPDGVLVTYRLGPGDGDARLRVLSPAGDTVRELRVPDGAGLHRVSWDLRHALPGTEPERWERFVHRELARPVDDRGPMVSPGTYTLVLEARGTAVEGSVDVRPDPLLALDFPGYRERERFLLEALRTADALESLAGTTEGDLGDRLDDAADALSDAAEGMIGNGAQQGALARPTATHRDLLERARQLLAEARAGAGADAPAPTETPRR